jgi:raffinose/stachyose/melibiose transport system permease protein
MAGTTAISRRRVDSDVTSHRMRQGIQRILVYAILTVAAIQTIYPLIWIIFGSLKSDPDLFNNIWGPPRLLVWQNYADAWRIGQMGDRIANSIMVTALSLALLLFVSSLAAYVLARLSVPGKQMIFVFFLITMMIPPEVTIIPLFLVVKTLGLLNSSLGLVLVYVASGTAFSTFLLRGFFLSIPSELEDAALVDGANHFQVFWRIVLPLALPGLATVAIFQGLTIWNEFFLAFIFIRQPELQTIPLGLANFFSRYQANWTQYFAALTMVAVPVVVLYVALQRWFVEGLTAGALKG